MPGATMKWKYYWRDIVKHLHVVLEGWPADIPMGNLSDIATSQPILQRLHNMWSNKEIVFHPVDDSELQELEKKRQLRIQQGEITPPEPRKIRTDKGKKRQAAAGRSSRKKGSSRALIDTDSESETDTANKENAPPRRKKRRIEGDEHSEDIESAD